MMGEQSFEVKENRNKLMLPNKMNGNQIGSGQILKCIFSLSTRAIRLTQLKLIDFKY